MRPSIAICPPAVHADCYVSKVTFYSPSQRSSLIRSRQYHHININLFSHYDIAKTSLPRRYTNTTQSQENFMKFQVNMKAFMSFLFTLYILVLIRNQGRPKQDIAFISPCSRLITKYFNMNNKTCATGEAGTVFP